jgi:RNA recognition motif-containing protein
VFEVFGALRSLQLVRLPNAAQHKGYGFVEYYDDDSAEVALASLQGLAVGGRVVEVKRAQSVPNLPDNGNPALINPQQQHQARIAAQQGMQSAAAVAASAGPVLATGDSGRLGDVQVTSQSERVELSRRLEASRNASTCLFLMMS